AMAFASKCAVVAVVALFALALTNDAVVDARRNQGSSQRKSSSGGSSSHVTQPSYSTNNNNNNGGGSNSHADVAKLSYPNYNSQPNRPANSNPPAPGWNVPQGPPPAYSAGNPAGGARTNVHEPPPAYHAPNYGAAPGSNVHQPITASQSHGQQYAGVPPGATYYPSGSHVPGAGGYQPSNLPAGATYYPSAGHVPSGGYHPAAAPPPGATYYQAGAALPPGATYYPQAPQQSSSSGLGFGTGLLAGGLGGALLGHALTPSGGSSSSQPVAAPAAGQDRIIIINNGVPVNATTSDGTTVINAGGAPAAPAADAVAPLAPMAPMNATQTDAAAAPPAQLAPFSTENAAPMANGTDAQAPPPPPGGIICVPTKVNETDPADSSKTIEVEKIACYPAPPPPAAAPGAEPVPLAPMANQSPPAMLAPDQAAVRSNTNSGAGNCLQGGTLPLLAAALLSGLMLRSAAAG
ncbi:hypothetical protein KR222_004847, partial [Zaprionus bogoriensis]